MADTHDTIDGLLAEFRGYSHGMPPSYHVTMSWADFRKMLDRFDVAHRHEVQNALDTGGFVEASRKNKQVGNVAKLREAVGYILKYADSVACRDHDEHTRHYIDQIRKWAQSALAAPPRNCDVGAAEEQEERFTKVCKANSKGGVRGLCSETCPFSRDYQSECALVWAQMPYEEGGDK